jgi:uracil-DNA glycosylase family 4
LCPRLVSYREDNRKKNPDWHNAPVPSFGALTAHFLVVGLAPGRMGANRTGRPFTGDYAGKLLYATLIKVGLAEGTYSERADDGLKLLNCRITNAVRCAPPANRPLPDEIKSCSQFLVSEMTAMPKLKGILALGLIAHNAVLTTFDLRKSKYPFAHGAMHEIGNGKILADSYHCSRLNTNTGRLTEAMFVDVVKSLKKRAGQPVKT